ncbi:MAG: hypothetical protein H0U60_17410 [Blastocatellia bacterium]|nr:hypothetical protein [Blastocatellia bacterium]
MRKLFLSSLIFLLVAAGTLCASAKPLREVLGLRLGMSEESVHKHMRKIATQQKEDREAEEGGEQEVWILKKDVRYLSHSERRSFMVAAKLRRRN